MINEMEGPKGRHQVAEIEPFGREDIKPQKFYIFVISECIYTFLLDCYPLNTSSRSVSV
jgi:hypothetical protein